MRAVFNDKGGPGDFDWELEKAFVAKNETMFRLALSTGRCTAWGMNRVLNFAASTGAEEYSLPLLKAGADRRIWLDGRLNYSAMTGDIITMEMIAGKGADLHNNREQPLRSAIVGLKKEAAIYLMNAGCKIEDAMHRDAIKSVFAPDRKRQVEITHLYMKLAFRPGENAHGEGAKIFYPFGGPSP